jgi:hypothetical protein
MGARQTHALNQRRTHQYNHPFVHFTNPHTYMYIPLTPTSPNDESFNPTVLRWVTLVQDASLECSKQKEDSGGMLHIAKHGFTSIINQSFT